MATSRPHLVVVHTNKTNESPVSPDELEFQDFGDGELYRDAADHTSAGASRDSRSESIHSFTNFPQHGDSDQDTDELLGEKPPPSFWTFEYYKIFFDVDTRHVIARILNSMAPRPGTNFLQRYIRPKPDLYGPFWICLTLVFTMAISGNLANYLHLANDGDYYWQVNFEKVTIGATAIFSYAWLVPLALWGVFWWRGNQVHITLLETVCVYGYSLSIYIPISVLWVIDLNWLRWIFVVVGFLLSGIVLMVTFWPAVRDDKKKISITVMAVIFLLHVLLAIGFKKMATEPDY